MKTWQALLAHLGTTALQAIVAAPAIDHTNSPLANTGVQIGAQLALTAIQGYVASKNSNSDPNGKPLVELEPGKFQTVAK